MSTTSTARVRRVVGRIRSDDTLSKKAALNMAAALLDYGVRVLISLLLVPLLVTRLGDRLYGVYQLLLRLIGYATPAGGRPSQALKWTIAREQLSEDTHAKRLQVGSALAVWTVFLPPLLIVGGVIAWVSPSVLGLDGELHTTVRVAAAFLVADLILTNLLTIPQSVVQGENLGYKSMGLTTSVLVVGGAVTAGLAVAGAGLIGVTASVVATTIMMGAAYLWIARRNVPWFGALRPPRAAFVSFMKLSGWFLAWNLVMQLMRASDVVVLGVADSPELVTVYTISRYVPEAIFSAVAIVISAIMPGLGGLVGASELRRAAATRAQSMSVTWLLATSTGAVYLLLQRSFVGLWVGSEYYPGPMASVLIIAMVMQFAFLRNDASIIDLTLDLKGKVLQGLVASVASVTIAYVLIRHADMGISGLAVGFIIGRAIVGVSYPVLVGRAFGISAMTQVRATVRPGVVTVAVFGAAVAGSSAIEFESVIGLVAAGLVSLAAVGGLTFFAGLTGDQRASLRARARQVVAS